MAECGENYGIVLTFINIVISCLTRKISMSSKEILFLTNMIVCFIYILIFPPKMTFFTFILTLSFLTTTKHPRLTIDLVQEDLGGIQSCSSNGSLPRNISQVYNCKKSVNATNKEAQSSDPYNALILKCKEESKDDSTAFIRNINIAPEPMVVCGNNKKLNDLVRLCIKNNFSIFQMDPTYDLGNIFVTTTQYENLFLLSRRTDVHPAIVGPVLIHQKKEQDTYSNLSQFLCTKRPAFKGLTSFGTDGEKGLGNAFSETCPSAIQLRCFIHFKKNLTEYMRKVGIDQFNQIQVCADLLEQQVGKDK